MANERDRESGRRSPPASPAAPITTALVVELAAPSHEAPDRPSGSRREHELAGSAGALGERIRHICDNPDTCLAMGRERKAWAFTEYRRTTATPTHGRDPALAACSTSPNIRLATSALPASLK